MTPVLRRLPVAVFLLLVGVYLLAMSGHTYSADEETMLAVTRAILASGSVDLAPTEAAGAPLAALRPGVDGGRYSPYGVLPSLLALPLHLLGGLAAPFGPAAVDYATRFAVTALNGPITAATAALLAAWALRLGASQRWALALALSYGLGTFALVYSRTFFSEPLAALLVMLAAERAHAAAQARTGTSFRRDLLLSGLACGLLLPTRIAAGVAALIVALYVLWVCWQASRSTARPSSFILHLSSFALGLLPGLAILLWYNLARFGTPLATGYASEAGLFTTPLLVGLYGLLLSPGKSVLLFAPPLLLALPGTVALWRCGERGVVLLGLGLFLSHLLLYAGWGEWEGGGVWGPRFMLPVVAPLFVLAAGLFGSAERRAQSAERGDAGAPGRAESRPGARVGVSERGWSPVWGVALVVLSLTGFVGNLGGTLLNFGTYVVMREPADKLYSLSGSPLVGHWRVLAERWGRFAAPPPACLLGDGLFASEDPAGGALPRRTGAQGELRCETREGARLAFALDDRRPPEASSSELRLLLDGRALAAPPPGQLREYHLLLEPGSARLGVEARTWNPLAVGFSDRDDELGPQLADLRGVAGSGAALAVVDTAVAPLPAHPRPRWAWYYDPPNQHLADHWAWYLPRSELAGPGAWVLGVVVVVVGAVCVGLGARGCVRSVRSVRA